MSGPTLGPNNSTLEGLRTALGLGNSLQASLGSPVSSTLTCHAGSHTANCGSGPLGRPENIPGMPKILIDWKARRGVTTR